MSSSMESCYFSCLSTPLRRKKLVSKMQMKCRYDENRWREWNSLRVYIYLFSVIYTYTNSCRILCEILLRIFHIGGESSIPFQVIVKIWEHLLEVKTDDIY